MPTWHLVVAGILTVCVIKTISASGAGMQTKCNGRRCLVDGLCSFNNNWQECVCAQGYTFADNMNDRCVDLDECGQHFHDPCGHRGVCMNTVGSYRCACLQGWKSNNHCLPKDSDPFLCMPGYTGNICSESYCGVNGYGQSVGDTDDYICVCNTGWTHKSSKGVCDVDVNECILTPGICANGAACENLNGTYRCQCLPDWHGTNCTHFNCTGRACANQGLCIDGACTCTGGWIGPDCRQRPTTTAMSTTENGYTAKEDTSGKKSSMNDTTTTAMSTTENGYTAKEDTSGKKSSMNDTTTTAMSTTENGYTAKEDTSGKKSSMNDTCGRSLFV
ncbi:fibropellin-1-like [Dreissena polymorpha]|nr:fibropellin-1-like [Dreissena polymorpha]